MFGKHVCGNYLKIEEVLVVDVQFAFYFPICY